MTVASATEEIRSLLRRPLAQVILPGSGMDGVNEPGMNLHLYLAYCFAVAILVLMPGPIVTLVVANSLGRGSRSGLATVAGASIGNAILLSATAVGLIAFFALLSEIFEVVRWVGALYLIWLGVKAWRAHGGKGPMVVPAAKQSLREVFVQGFLVAITNPKAIVFYIAFLPQFIDSHLAAGPQLLLMIGTMIVMALLSDGSYALLAGRARSWFTTPARQRLQSRISGTLLIGVGCGLLLARRGS
jgi:homoserine/homoserine lactone efflux protein